MTRRGIDTALPYWQALLGLNEWHITVRTVPQREMADANTGTEGPYDGLNTINPEHMESTILLARGANEETLVHELLHLVLDGDQEQRGVYEVLHERAINRLARALIRLHLDYRAAMKKAQTA